MKNYKNISLVSIAAMVISTLMVLLYQKSSYASFNVCNQTNRKILVAIAYNKEAFSYVEGNIDKVGLGAWQAEGWYHISPGKCATTLSKNLKPLSKIYYYAESDSEDYVWGGDLKFCVSRNRFSLGLGRNNYVTCEENFRTYQERERKRLYNLGFRSRKLGAVESFTLNLR
ncbi:MAG: DUF1036 domain-containing protein [Rivularia sp. (in: cyanobacteria)]